MCTFNTKYSVSAGVDIPSINQIIMLRPTQSAIVFVQQLGRGLRKSPNKEYVVIIDFIGNYANNYLVPIALYGDHSYNKDNLRRLMNGGSCMLPGVSTVNFDCVTKERIYKAIDQSNMATKKALVEEYKLLKYKLGRIPSMMDFVYHGSRDPWAFVEYSGSYYRFITSIGEDLGSVLTDEQKSYLEFYSKEVGNGKRIEELILLKLLVDQGSVSKQNFSEIIEENYGYPLSERTFESCLRYLNSLFFKQQDQSKYRQPHSVVVDQEILTISDTLQGAIKNDLFRSQLKDAIEYGIYEFNRHYRANLYEDGLIRYRKYSRKDVCRLLNWENDESSTMYGYRIKYNTCPIFVTYHKQDDISEATKYEDCFINRKQFSWMTRHGVTMESKEVIAIREHQETSLKMPLFIKKSDGEGSDFYYMGEVSPMAMTQTVIKNEKGEDRPIVNIVFDMNDEVPNDLYDYLIQ